MKHMTLGPLLYNYDKKKQLIKKPQIFAPKSLTAIFKGSVALEASVWGICFLLCDLDVVTEISV